jgi:hypothetical protein
MASSSPASAQFPYLSQLREPQVLAKAISETLARSDAKYAIADRFDDAKGEHVGLRLAQLVTIDFNSDTVLSAFIQAGS